MANPLQAIKNFIFPSASADTTEEQNQQQPQQSQVTTQEVEEAFIITEQQNPTSQSNVVEEVVEEEIVEEIPTEPTAAGEPPLNLAPTAAGGDNLSDSGFGSLVFVSHNSNQANVNVGPLGAFNANSSVVGGGVADSRFVNFIEAVADTGIVFERGLLANEQDLPFNPEDFPTVVTGNLLENDDLGALTVSIVSVNGVTADANGIIQINTDIGTFILYTQDFDGNLAGDYQYTLAAATTEGVNDIEVFTYTLTEPLGSISTANLTINIVDDEPIVFDDANEVNESQIEGGTGVGGGSDIATGNLLSNDYLGADAEGGIITTVAGEVAVDGVITVTTDAGVLQVFATADAALANGATVAGDYRYTLLNPTLYNVNDVEVFAYEYIDADGDVATANLTINIIDDAPIANADGAADEFNVFEGALATGSGDAPTEGEVTTGNILENDLLGADGATIFSVNGVEADENGVILLEKATWQLQLFTTDAAAQAAGQVAAGDFIFTLKQAVDSTITSGVNFTYVVVDNDNPNNTATSTLQINIIDDAPVAADDNLGTVFESNLLNGTNPDAAATILTGNLLDNDTTSADGITITSVNGNNFENVISLNTAAGILMVFATDAAAQLAGYSRAGDYVYQLTTATALSSETFSYTITDGDGSQSSAQLTVNIIDDTPALVTKDGGAVDESALSDGSGGGSAVLTGNILVGDNFGADGFGNILSVAGEVDAGDGRIVVQGDFADLIVYTTVAAAEANGFSAIGDYELTLHTATAETEINYQYTVVDGDGSEASAAIDFSINDDVPQAFDDDITFEADDIEEEDLIIGNVLSNDVLGADGATITAVNGFGVEEPNDDFISVQGIYGQITLYIDATDPDDIGFFTYEITDDDYVFTGEEQEVFTYTLTDNDSSFTSVATITITFEATLPEEPVDGGGMNIMLRTQPMYIALSDVIDDGSNNIMQSAANDASMPTHQVVLNNSDFIAGVVNPANDVMDYVQSAALMQADVL